ncbi:MULTISPECIES: hypothetical protein [unclassified Nocardioides]|uniref:hypothetical protein n=1 Tax=unclassified Nocardioides TaxID=2615069 RepID=UPI0036138164
MADWRLQPAVRALSAATAAGAVLGLVVGGIGGRVAMGVLASQNPEDAGVISDDGFEMGRISAGGTAQLLFSTLQLGLVGGLIYLALRTLAIGPSWFRIACLTAGGTVVLGAALIHQDGVDFTLLDPDWLPVVLFLAIPLVFIPAVALLIERWLRPTSWFQTAKIEKVAPLLAVWIFSGPLLVLPIVGLGLAYGVHTFAAELSATARSVVAWLLRAGFGALGVFALLALIGDIDAVT